MTGRRFGSGQRFKEKNYRRFRNKERKKRIPLEEKMPTGGEGEGVVVKGVSKRVVIVKSPDPRVFEQAIFIVREDFAGQAGWSEKDVLREARRAAGNYLRTDERRALRWIERLRAPLYACAGAAAAALAWTAVHFANIV